MNGYWGMISAWGFIVFQLGLITWMLLLKPQNSPKKWKVNKKQLGILFLGIAGCCCVHTSLAGMAFVFKQWGEFLGWLGPCLAGWYLFFIVGKKLSEVNNDE